MATGTITVDATSTHIHVTGFDPNEGVKVDLRYHHGGVDANYMGINAYGKTNATGVYDVTVPLGSDFVEMITGETLDYADADIREARIDAVHTTTQA